MGYALFIYNTLESNKDKLVSDIENIYDIYNNTNINNIINSNTYNIIHKYIFIYYLESIKPCYIDRLAYYTNTIIHNIVNNTNNTNTIFNILLSLISNTKEFINTYKEVLCNRILNNSNIYKDSNIYDIEYNILNNINKILNSNTNIYDIYNTYNNNIYNDNNICNMLNDLKSNYKHIKLLCNNTWNIPCEYTSLTLPMELIRLIEKEIPHFISKHTSHNKSIYYIDDSNININSNSNSNIKNIFFAHQYSKITIRINNSNNINNNKNSNNINNTNNIYIVNIYQYIIIDMLCNNTYTPYEIYRRIDMNDKKIESILYSLVNNNIIEYIHGKYRIYDNINSNNINNSNTNNTVYDNVIDISNVDLDYIYNRQVDATSYFLSLISRRLKIHKYIAYSKLYKEVRDISHFSIDNNTYSRIIQEGIEKGFIEREIDNTNINSNIIFNDNDINKYKILLIILY